MEWISVKDKMPEIGQNVDIYSKYYGRRTDYEYEGEGIFYLHDWDITYTIHGNYPITHWIPVPKYPKPE